MKIKWKPQPKQEIVLRRIEDEILYGGARGGGKTDAGMAWLMYDLDKPKYRALVIRQHAVDLSDWIDRAKDFYSGAGGRFTGDKFTFPSGAIIKTGHLADKDAYQKYQGHEYQKILIEELTHISRESNYEKLLASCRSTVMGIKSQIFCTTNPDGAGYEWVKERWSIPDIPDMDKIYKTVNEDGDLTRVFVPSTMDDNQVLMESDPKYVKKIEAIKDEELRRAWRDGSWEGFGVEGSYYRTQIRDAKDRIVEGLYDPMLEVYTWCDLGIADSFAIGYFQKAHNQWRVIDYDEFEGESLKEAINRMKDKDYVYAEHHAPHDIEVRELGTGVTRKETAQGFGVDYNTVPKLPIQDGIDALRIRFPTLWFDKKKCSLLLSRLRRYTKEFDEKRGVYKNKPVHDINSHGADMMRYWAVTKVYQEDFAQEDRIMRNRRNSTSMI